MEFGVKVFFLLRDALEEPDADILPEQFSGCGEKSPAALLEKI